MRLRDLVLLFLLTGWVGFGMARGGGPMQATWDREGGSTGGTIPVGPPPEGGLGGNIPVPPDGVEGGGIIPPSP